MGICIIHGCLITYQKWIDGSVGQLLLIQSVLLFALVLMQRFYLVKKREFWVCKKWFYMICYTRSYITAKQNWKFWWKCNRIKVLTKCMVPIHIFFDNKLGETNIKKIKNNNFDNGKDRERQYQENMKADQCMLQMFSYLFLNLIVLHFIHIVIRCFRKQICELSNTRIIQKRIAENEKTYCTIHSLFYQLL